MFDSKRQKRRWCGEWRSYKIQEARSQGGKQGIKCRNVHQQPLTNGDRSPPFFFSFLPSFLLSFFSSFSLSLFFSTSSAGDAAYKTCCVCTRAMSPEAVAARFSISKRRETRKKRFQPLPLPFLPLPSLQTIFHPFMILLTFVARKIKFHKFAIIE